MCSTVKILEKKLFLKKKKKKKKKKINSVYLFIGVIIYKHPQLLFT